MMVQYVISSRNGRIRAESEDGETVTLYLWNKAGHTAQYADQVAEVRLADLRQIIGHFMDSLEGEPPSRGQDDSANDIAAWVKIDGRAFARIMLPYVGRAISQYDPEEGA